MHMCFWWTTAIDNFLFQGYNIRSTGGLVSTCVGLLAIAVVFEWLKLLQARLRQQELFLRAKQIRTICPPSEDSTLLFTGRHFVQTVNVTFCDRTMLVIWDVFIWFNIQTLSYLLMLSVMVYNGWMVISLILGSAIGYYIFGPSFMKLNLKNCQIIRDTFCSLNCNETEHDGDTTPVLEATTSTTSITNVPSNVSVCVHTQSGESV